MTTTFDFWPWTSASYFFRLSNRNQPKGGCSIGGFRDAYLGRQVVSRPGGDGVSWASGGALWAPLAGLGRSPSRYGIWCLFSLKIWHRVATISIIFLKINWPNFPRLNSKDKSWQSQKYLGRQCLPLPLIKSDNGLFRGGVQGKCSNPLLRVFCDLAYLMNVCPTCSKVINLPHQTRVRLLPAARGVWSHLLLHWSTVSSTWGLHIHAAARVRSP